jgi:hypothetical protein
MSAAPLCLSAGRYPPHRIWTHKYPAIASALKSVPCRQAYLDQAELTRLWRRLQLLAMPKMPLDVPPSRSTRFGSPLVLSRVVGTVLRSATYSEGILSGIGAPQPSRSSRKADCQFRVTVSWAQLRN